MENTGSRRGKAGRKTSSYDIVPIKPILAAPFKRGRMARREHQMPEVLRQEGPRPYWYVRYRVKILIGKNHIKRQEKWHRLGYCDEMSKREAQRLRDQIMEQINRQVYTLQSHIDFEEFVKIYREKHFPTLSSGTKASIGLSSVITLSPASLG
jgi:hypothetical protein